MGQTEEVFAGSVLEVHHVVKLSEYVVILHKLLNYLPLFMRLQILNLHFPGSVLNRIIVNDILDSQSSLLIAHYGVGALQRRVRLLESVFGNLVDTPFEYFFELALVFLDLLHRQLLNFPLIGVYLILHLVDYLHLFIVLLLHVLLNLLHQLFSLIRL